MTTTLIIDGSKVPEVETPASTVARSRTLTRDPKHALSFGGVLRSERIKLMSLRSIRVTLVITVLAGLALSALIALLWSMDLREFVTAEGFSAADLQGYLLMTATFTAPFMALIFGVLGVFAIASEYSSGMILSSLSAVPRRGMLFAGKALMTTVIAGITALVLVGGGLGIALAVMPEASAQLFSPTVLTGALGSVLYLILIALLGFGVAGCLRSTAGGIAVIAGLTFVLPIAFQVLVITGWEWVPTVAQYLPSNLGGMLAQGTAATEPVFGVALLAMAIWATAAIVPAVITMQRRDAR